MNIDSSDDPLLADSGQTDRKSKENTEGSPIIQIKLVPHLLAVRQIELIVSIITLHKLKVPCRCFRNSAEEIQSIAPTCMVILRRQVFKFTCDHASLQVVELSSKGSGFLGEEVRVVFDCLQQVSFRVEVFGKALSDQLQIHATVK